ncbi:uncharacterized protein LOC129771883 [Toxorhynchites rutilus septentrionalis]|uniref:uncharacterized protein LOC129771883 n=1 Tax=Toxorhynchites rutilus septentrionalis TaxID=329112 RepID=UPI00247B178D|nr:uncharacterized protein LOC129771883 [Toxorhynchites rutilus septentrionalis]
MQKALLVCLLLAFAGQSLAQSEDEFLEYLLNIQNKAETVHQLMEGSFDRARFAMSEQLLELNRWLVGIMNNALEEVEKLQTDMGALLNTSTALPACLTVVQNNWELEITKVGSTLQSCAAQATLDIIRVTADVHGAIEAAQPRSTELQNIVVRGFINWNALDNTEQLSAIVGAQIQEKYENFRGVTLPGIDRTVQNVYSLSAELPARIRRCAGLGVERLNNYARVVAETLSFCH